MTILLTGASGFLGARIVDVLRARGLAWQPLRARLLEAQAAELDGIATVIHCAALTPARAAREEDFLEVNVRGTERLLALCERLGVRRFVYVSSMGVKFPSAYAFSKLLAEDRVKSSSLEWLVLRPAHIYGPTAQLRGTMAKLERKRTWSVLGHGRNPVQIVYVEDCAAAVVDAALSPRAFETLNVIAPEYAEIDYIRTLRKVTGSSAVILRMPLFWARMRRGRAAVADRIAGLRIPGVADWPLTATPLETAMQRIRESFRATASV